MITETIPAATAHERVQKAAAPHPEVRDFTAAEIGKVARQGDVYLHRVAADHGRGKEASSDQLAVGTTQGSRHIVAGDCEVFDGTTAPNWCERTVFLGPCIVVGPDGATVTHPEHAHIALGEGTYQVTHQLDATTQQRVAD